MASSYRKPDHFTRKAKEAGFPARSVFKLAELDQKFRVLPRGSRVVDLGCFPGSWSRYLIQQGCTVVGVDLKAPDLSGGHWLVGSALEVTAEQLLAPLGGPADALVSDMAPSTTGSRFTDHCRQIELARRALALSQAVVRPNGSFVVKVFDGEDAPAYTREVQQVYAEVRRYKPEATRDTSVEFFLVAKGKRA